MEERGKPKPHREHQDKAEASPLVKKRSKKDKRIEASHEKEGTAKKEKLKDAEAAAPERENETPSKTDERMAASPLLKKRRKRDERMEASQEKKSTAKKEKLKAAEAAAPERENETPSNNDDRMAASPLVKKRRKRDERVEASQEKKSTAKKEKLKAAEAAAPETLKEREYETPQGKKKSGSEKGGKDKAEKSGKEKCSWNSNDEIAFLSGIAYCARRGTMLPKSYLFSYVKNNYLDGQYTDTQLDNKMKKLKQKFKNMEKNEQSGFRFHSPHDKAKFELSKNIWGREREEKTTARRNANEEMNENISKKPRHEEDEDEEEEDVEKDEYQIGAFKLKEVGEQSHGKSSAAEVSNEMIQGLPVSGSSMKLREAEEKKLKRKLLKQEARKIEAYIKSLALKQQKLRRKLEKLRAPGNT